MVLVYTYTSWVCLVPCNEKAPSAILILIFITQAFLLLMDLAIPLTIVNSFTTYTLSVFCSSSTYLLFGVFLLHSINFCLLLLFLSSTVLHRQGPFTWWYTHQEAPVPAASRLSQRCIFKLNYWIVL